MEKISIEYEVLCKLGIKTQGNPCYKIDENRVAIPSIEDAVYFSSDLLGYTAVIYEVNLSTMTAIKRDSCNVGGSTNWKWKYSSIEKWCEEIFQKKVIK